jgi:hypothetical protein
MCKVTNSERPVHAAARVANDDNADNFSGDGDAQTRDILSGWFHPTAVDALAQWCAEHAAELTEEVAPISHQELRMCDNVQTIETEFLSEFCSEARLHFWRPQVQLQSVDHHRQQQQMRAIGLRRRRLRVRE